MFDNSNAKYTINVQVQKLLLIYYSFQWQFPLIQTPPPSQYCVSSSERRKSAPSWHSSHLTFIRITHREEVVLWGRSRTPSLRHLIQNLVTLVLGEFCNIGIMLRLAHRNGDFE